MSQQARDFCWDNKSWPFSNYDSSIGDDKINSKKKPPLGTNSSSSSPSTTMVINGTSCKRWRGNGDGEEDKGKDKSEDGMMNEGGKKGSDQTSDHEAHIWTERERRKKMRNMFSTLHSLLPQLPPKADKATIVDEAVTYIKNLQQILQRLQRKKQATLQGAKTTTISTIPSALSSLSRQAFIADQVASSSISSIPSAASTNVLSSLMKTSSSSSVNVGSNSTSPSMVQHRQLTQPAITAGVVLQTWTSPNLVLNIMSGGDDQAQFTICCPKKNGLLTDICFVLDKHKIDILYFGISSDANTSIYTIRAQVQATNGTGVQFFDVIGVEETYKQAAAEMIQCISS